MGPPLPGQLALVITQNGKERDVLRKEASVPGGRKEAGGHAENVGTIGKGKKSRPGLWWGPKLGKPET